MKKRRDKNIMIEQSYSLASEERFPNLLADEDFVRYYWTLPFCNL